jgi:hypothetical protein
VEFLYIYILSYIISSLTVGIKHQNPYFIYLYKEDHLNTNERTSEPDIHSIRNLFILHFNIIISDQCISRLLYLSILSRSKAPSLPARTYPQLVLAELSCFILLVPPGDLSARVRLVCLNVSKSTQLSSPSLPSSYLLVLAAARCISTAAYSSFQSAVDVKATALSSGALHQTSVLKSITKDIESLISSCSTSKAREIMHRWATSTMAELVRTMLSTFLATPFPLLMQMNPAELATLLTNPARQRLSFFKSGASAIMHVIAGFDTGFSFFFTQTVKMQVHLMFGASL